MGILSDARFHLFNPALEVVLLQAEWTATKIVHFLSEMIKSYKKNKNTANFLGNYSMLRYKLVSCEVNGTSTALNFWIVTSTWWPFCISFVLSSAGNMYKVCFILVIFEFCLFINKQSYCNTI